MPCCSCCGLSVSFLGVTLINYFLKYSVMMRRDGRPARAASRIRFEGSSCLLNMSFLFTSFWRGPSCPKQKHFLWPHSNQQLFDPAQRLGVQRMTLYAQLGLTADCFVSQVGRPCNRSLSTAANSVVVPRCFEEWSSPKCCRREDSLSDQVVAMLTTPASLTNARRRVRLPCRLAFCGAYFMSSSGCLSASASAC